jgi:hypothetical protein
MAEKSKCENELPIITAKVDGKPISTKNNLTEAGFCAAEPTDQK